MQGHNCAIERWETKSQERDGKSGSPEDRKKSREQETVFPTCGLPVIRSFGPLNQSFGCWRRPSSADGRIAQV